MESLTSQFERQVAVFLRRSRLTPSEFGTRAVGDRKFLGDVHRGRSPRLTTVDRVLEFIEAYSQAHGLDRSGDPSIEPGRGRPGDPRTSENGGEEET